MSCFSWGSSFCGVPLSGIPPLFRYSTVVPWCSGYSAGVPRSVVPSSGVPALFRRSVGVPCSVMPCSGVPGFIVCPARQGQALHAVFSHAEKGRDTEQPQEKETS